MKVVAKGRDFTSGDGYIEIEIEVSDEIVKVLENYDLMIRLPKKETKPVAFLDERGGRFRQR